MRDPARLQALEATGLLDTGPEESFDRLTRLATLLLDAPVSLVSLIDEKRQYFKSAAGLSEPWVSGRETPLSHSICQHVVNRDERLVISDAREVDALGDNLAVEHGAVAYAGVPLRAPGGEVYGAFCVIDSKPRAWSDEQVALVEQLAEAVLGEIDLRNRLAHIVRHDPLTGLPNRDQFLASIEATLTRAGPRSVVVVMLDVPRLELVNESLGHEGSDKLLIGVASRLKNGLPSTLIARVAGGRFATLWESGGEREALALADRIRSLFADPFHIEGEVFHTAPSLGIVVADATDSAAEVLEGAGAALRHAQEAPTRLEGLGRDRSRGEALNQFRVENQLRLAIQRHQEQLGVVYQPKVRLLDLRLTGFEALLRWESPTLGSVPPSDFIPMAEESGLIVALGQFVLEEACRQAARWRALAPQLDLSVAVNLSPRQIRDVDVTALVEGALESTGVPPDALRLEITESAVMARSPDELALLDKLRALGVHIDLDDFGTGYSSLAQLSSLPLDSLKIDGSFVGNLSEEGTEAVVGAIVAMASKLGLAVVAEGVETHGQLDQLREMGCDCGQGYLFARPQAAEKVCDLVATAISGPGPRGWLGDGSFDLLSITAGPGSTAGPRADGEDGAKVRGNVRDSSSIRRR